MAKRTSEAAGTGWDLLIHDALVYDGSGRLPRRLDVAVREGRVAALGEGLDRHQAAHTLDGAGQWLLPGLLDIHTHFDLEVEVEPGLPEAVRHGTTTVVMSNCSLGLAYGLLPDEAGGRDDNAIVNCFARVENMPKSVLAAALGERVDWDEPGAYLQHLDTLPLGANVVPMIPHSMLRIAVMGMEAAVRRAPTDEEVARMCESLERAMQRGYVGMSTDGLPLHFLANDPYREVAIPAQHASRAELAALCEIVRRHEGIVQFTPNAENRLATAQLLFMSCGRLHGKPLRMTATAAMDLNSAPRAYKALLGLSKLINSDFMRGHFRFQALSAPFVMYGDGATAPVMEEKPSFRQLAAIDLDDRQARQQLLNDPAFCEQFRQDWMAGKSGWTLAHLRRRLQIEPELFARKLEEMTMVSCPESRWNGENLQSLYERLRQFQHTGGREGARDGAEAEAFRRFPDPADEADFLLHLLRSYDREFRWSVITANQRPEVLKELVFHPQTLPGFNDSGAHLTNMAFFDGNLRTLQLAQQDGSPALMARAVRRLTADAADLFGLDVGRIEIGARADLVMIDPQALASYDSEACTRLIHREIFDHPQMVNRSDGVVRSVIIGGQIAWDGEAFTPEFGQQAMGRPLTRRGTSTAAGGETPAGEAAAAAADAEHAATLPAAASA